MRLLPSLVLGVWTLLSHSAAESAMQEAKHFVVDIISINGEEFVVKDENGKEANIHVGTETEKFRINRRLSRNSKGPKPLRRCTREKPQ
jgi:hypothetical protein